MTKFVQSLGFQYRFILWFIVNCTFYYFYCAIFPFMNWLAIVFSFGLFLILPFLVLTRVLIPDVFANKPETREVRTLLGFVFFASMLVYFFVFLRGQEEFGGAMPRHSRMVNEFVKHKQDFEQLVRLSRATENAATPLGERQYQTQIIRFLSPNDQFKWKRLAGQLPLKWTRLAGDSPSQPYINIYRERTPNGFEYWFRRYQISAVFGNFHIKSFVYTKTKYPFYSDYKFVILSRDWYWHTRYN
jgi:hypothetical protein